jgi:hypothetical protein
MLDLFLNAGGNLEKEAPFIIILIQLIILNISNMYLLLLPP